jgi:HSP20 family molecular chaperone IbpA
MSDTITAEGNRLRVRPATDVFETEDSLVVLVDVPGVDLESLDLTLEESVLRLRARSTLGAPEGWEPLGSEFELPDYERSFRLAAEVDQDSVEARLENGRLRVELRKLAPPTRRITVQASQG